MQCFAKTGIFLVCAAGFFAINAFAADDDADIAHAPLPPPKQAANTPPAPNPLLLPPLPVLPFRGHPDLVITTQTAPPPVPLPPNGFITSPTADEVLSVTPPAVSITLSRPVIPEQSYIRVVNSKGAMVNDNTLAVNATTMSTALPALAAGRYKVKWQAVFAGGQPRTLSNSFDFSVPRHHSAQQ